MHYCVVGNQQMRYTSHTLQPCPSALSLYLSSWMRTSSSLSCLLCKTTTNYWTISISVMVSLWILNSYKWDKFWGFSCDWIGESSPLHEHFQFSLVYCGSDWKLNSTVLTFFALIIIPVLASQNVNSFRNNFISNSSLDSSSKLSFVKHFILIMRME